MSVKKVRIEELLAKGVENIYPNREFLLKQLKSGKKLTIYQGFDPTADTLHIGNAVGLIKLKQFQDLGHKVVFLIGDYTAMIGDPDKRTVREPLTREQVLNNCKDYKKQASKILNFNGKNPVELKFNSKWLSKLNFGDILELLTHFSVQRMLERDLFQERIKSGNPLYIHEFMYPVMQAYDCVVMGVDGEVGGNDQTFNMLTGRELMKTLKKKEKFIVTMKLLAEPGGKKMGKTEGNMIRLDDSPEEMFGKIMSWPDGVIPLGFELCTFSATEKVKAAEESLRAGKINPRDLKAELAKEIVGIYYGEAKAAKAEGEFNKVFRDKELPTKMVNFKALKEVYPILDLLYEAGLAPSKSEAKRLIIGKGVKIDGETKTDWNESIKIENGVVVQVGKLRYARITR